MCSHILLLQYRCTIVFVALFIDVFSHFVTAVPVYYSFLLHCLSMCSHILLLQYRCTIVFWWGKWRELAKSLIICHLILTKINCIALKIRSKADFNSKSQNIWQQIILFSSTVMQMICAWHKIWTLSRRLSLMRNVQLIKNK